MWSAVRVRLSFDDEGDAIEHARLANDVSALQRDAIALAQRGENRCAAWDRLS